jgi:hypothetical protein
MERLAAFEDDGLGVSSTDLGNGLLFCKENLTFKTVGLTSVLRGLVQEIVLQACGPARTKPGAANTAADGRQFCCELACYTNAVVKASTDTQYYQILQHSNRIDMGAWEGNVLKFYPSGSVTPVTRSRQ